MALGPTGLQDQQPLRIAPDNRLPRCAGFETDRLGLFDRRQSLFHFLIISREPLDLGDRLAREYFEAKTR